MSVRGLQRSVNVLSFDELLELQQIDKSLIHGLAGGHSYEGCIAFALLSLGRLQVYVGYVVTVLGDVLLDSLP